MGRNKQWGIAFTYVGAVVGAGFSSGQEIWHFFARHQANGILGVILVGISFSALGPILFQLGKLYQVNSYHLLFYKTLPRPFPLIFDLIYTLFLLGSVSVMLAGSGAIFYDILGVPKYFGILLTLVLIFIILFLKVEGIFTVNGFLIPVLLLITVLTIIKYFTYTGTEQFKMLLSIKPDSTGWVFDAILYLSYNLVIAVAVMIGIVSGERNEDILRGSGWGGILLFSLNVIIYLGLITTFHDTPQEEIPMLYLAKKGGYLVTISYVIALYFAMVSTAVANYYAFTLRFISLLKVNYQVGLLITGVMVLPLARSGFSVLIDKLYPIYGYIGLYILGYYVYLWFKKINF